MPSASPVVLTRMGAREENAGGFPLGRPKGGRDEHETNHDQLRYHVVLGPSDTLRSLPAPDSPELEVCRHGAVDLGCGRCVRAPRTEPPGPRHSSGHGRSGLGVLRGGVRDSSPHANVIIIRS